MPANPDIHTLVATFTNDLSTVMRRAALDEVLAKLSLVIGDVTPKRRGPRRPRATVSDGVVRTGKRGRPGKFTLEQLDAMGGKILALLKKSPAPAASSSRPR